MIAFNYTFDLVCFNMHYMDLHLNINNCGIEIELFMALLGFTNDDRLHHIAIIA